jgi:hypothetical protein
MMGLYAHVTSCWQPPSVQKRAKPFAEIHNSSKEAILYRKRVWPAMSILRAKPSRIGLAALDS